MDNEYKILEIINGWINNCDAKTSILTAFVGAIIVLFTQGFDNINFLVTIFELESIEIWNWCKFYLIIILTLTILVLITLILINIYIVLVGKIDFDAYKKNCKSFNGKKSLLFFQSIASLGFDDYLDSVKKRSQQGSAMDIHEQIYHNSIRCKEKFEKYNRALLYTFILLACVLLFVFLSFLY